jgi:Dolichyl-phosphate-mannose-protein mannosyltransferase
MARRLSFLFTGLSALALFLYVALALMRCSHPFELEWQEGGMLQAVERALQGKPLYARPTLEYMAFPYPPLFVWLSALATKLLGPGFLAPRLVSILASFGCCLFLQRIAARRAQSALAGWFAAGLFAASYRFCGAWFDVARVDSLFLALSLLGIELVEARRSPRGAAFGGFAFALACFAKQSALVPALAVGLALGWRDRRAALPFALACFLPLALAAWSLDGASGGWFHWYVFDLLRGAPWSAGMAGQFWVEMLAHFAPALLLCLLGRPRAPAGEAPVLAFALAGMGLVAWVSRAHAGGYDNVLMPACAAAALCFGVALARALCASRAVVLAAGALGLAQFALLVYDPREQLPTEADRLAGEALVVRIAATRGEVWIPDHGYLARRAGKRPFAHGMTWIDLLQSREGAEQQQLLGELRAAIDGRRFEAVVLDEPWESELDSLARNYSREDLVWDGPRTFLPVTGYPRRPSFWYGRH